MIQMGRKLFRELIEIGSSICIDPWGNTMGYMIIYAHVSKAYGIHHPQIHHKWVVLTKVYIYIYIYTVYIYQAVLLTLFIYAYIYIYIYVCKRSKWFGFPADVSCPILGRESNHEKYEKIIYWFLWISMETG